MADVTVQSVTVRSPATSANLGPGFDSFGLCLGLFDTVRVEVAAAGLVVEVQGECAGALPVDSSHLVVRAMYATFGLASVSPPGLRVSCVNRVPHGRGLGSSAAAIVAGVLAADALSGRNLDAGRLLELAARIEGHADNVAACLLGGFTIAWDEGDRTRAVSLDVHPGVRPVAFLPPEQVSTQQMRALLPAQIAHSRASANVARAGLLVEALSRRPELLLAATEDFLHQEYRARQMPASAQLVAALRESGVAAFISGAGPAVLALGTQAAEPSLDRWLPPGWTGLRLDVGRVGAQVVVDCRE